MILDKDTENITGQSDEAEPAAAKSRSPISRAMVILGLILTIAAGTAAVVMSFYMPVIWISGQSTEPAYSDGDVLVLFKSGNYKSGELCCIKWENKLLLRRVIGVPGDRISIDQDGNVFVNELLLDEPYATAKCLGECDITFPYEVPEGEFFVLGDNRDTAIDSRSSAVGCIGKERLVGRVLFKVWPLGDS